MREHASTLQNRSLKFIYAAAYDLEKLMNQRLSGLFFTVRNFLLVKPVSSLFIKTNRYSPINPEPGCCHRKRRFTYAVTVSVVYFDLGQGEDYVYHGRTEFKGVHKNDTLMLSESQKKIFNRESLCKIYPDHYVIKVNEFDDIARDNLDEWIYFFKNSEIKNEFRAKGVAEAREKLKEINLPENERRSYKRYLQNLMDEASIALTIRVEQQFAREKGYEEGMEDGLEKGIEKGREEGREEVKLETAREFLKNGISPEVIAMATGFTLERIKKLADTGSV